MAELSEQAGVRRGRSQRHPMVAFFVLTFGIAWAAWVPVAAESRGYLDTPVPQSAAALVGAFAPTLAAIGLTVLHE